MCRKTKKKVRVLRRSGEWCRICHNVYRLRFRMKFKKSLNKFKAAITETNPKKQKDKELFEKAKIEYMHLKGGGKSRIVALPGRVIARRRHSVTAAPRASGGRPIGWRMEEWGVESGERRVEEGGGRWRERERGERRGGIGGERGRRDMRGEREEGARAGSWDEGMRDEG